MNNAWEECRELLTGNPDTLSRWIETAEQRHLSLCFTAIVAGCGAYGATIGLWRDGFQALYTAIKFPLLILITCGGNALLNGMLAQVFGIELGFKQTTLAILMSFTISSLILAAFVPLSLFLFWNTPPLKGTERMEGHSLTLLAHVALIAYAGTMGNQRLFRLLNRITKNRSQAWLTLFAWLGGNLLLGSQISWILRPFIGSPNLPVQFLRPDPLRGNFFESVAHALQLLVS